MTTVAVFGASGFVGSTVVERLLASSEFEVIPVIHSAGSAWRLARLGLDLEQVDVLSGDETERVVKRSTYVVNCTRGPDTVMLNGLRNLLDASLRHKVQRFVHLSSVMVYGDPPRAEREDAERPPMPKNSYGHVKQLQDAMVAKASGQGLRSTILIPPNISGPFSDYLIGLTNVIGAGQFALLEDGHSPCSLVDVTNLAWAIELALSRDPAENSSYFVTDGIAATWAQLVRDLQELVVTEADVGTVSRADLQAATAQPSEPRISLIRSMKHLVSSDIREALRKDPLWEKLDVTVRGWIGRLGPKLEERLRLSIEGPAPVRRRSHGPGFHARLCGQQLRDVHPSIDKIRQDLGYEPRFSYDQSMAAFKRWYREMHALDSDYLPLLRLLYQ